MIFAQRRSQDFITPARVVALEEWSGRTVLEAVTSFHIPVEVRVKVRLETKDADEGYL